MIYTRPPSVDALTELTEILYVRRHFSKVILIRDSNAGT